MDKKLFKIIKDSEDFRKIKKELDTQMQGQCYCLINSDKFLRESFLEVLLSYAFCNEVDKPCGGCVKCEQIKNNNNIDVSYFGDDGVQVKKEDIEKLLESAITKPYENKHKLTRLHFGAFHLFALILPHRHFECHLYGKKSASGHVGALDQSPEYHPKQNAPDPFYEENGDIQSQTGALRPAPL